MAEEQRIQEGHRLCANNCGFFGSPATQNLCSKCFTDSRMKQEQASSAKSAVEKSLSVSSSPPSTASTPAAPPSHPPLFLPEVAAPPTPSLAADVRAPPDPESAPAPTAQPQPGRCFACRRRVGLTGFRCRCGSTFCGTHRYPELHECSFDFKTSGREAIARDNPVVRAEKLARI